MPTNLFGPNDKYSRIHVISTLIKRIHQSKINNSYVTHGAMENLKENLCMLMIALK